MVFVSYAQNSEDVILWRALKQVENGFYIDIGTADLSNLSVTRALYERGWQGINIEPAPAYFARCVEERPRDVNLNLVASNRTGRLHFLHVPSTGLFTLDPVVANATAARGFTVELLEVEAKPLSTICDEAGVTEIQLLKIDAKGTEQAVLAGANFARHRPWVVVVKTIVPLTTIRNEASWEPILLEAGYLRAFFDGVSFYYVAKEHEELLPLLAVPPNALDNFKPVALAKAEARIAALEAVAATCAATQDALDRTHATLQQSEIALALAHRNIGRRDQRLVEQDWQLQKNTERLRYQEYLLKHVASLLPASNCVANSDIPQRLQEHLITVAQEIQQLKDSCHELSQHRDMLLASTSWRLTAPLRKIRTALQVIRRDPRNFVPLLLRNLRCPQPAYGEEQVAVPAPTRPVSVPRMPPDYDRRTYRDRLVTSLHTDIIRQRQLRGEI